MSNKGSNQALKRHELTQAGFCAPHVRAHFSDLSLAPQINLKDVRLTPLPSSKINWASYKREHVKHWFSNITFDKLELKRIFCIFF